MENDKKTAAEIRGREPEWTGSVWKHPYLMYVWITMLLFGFLLFMAWLASTQGWIPER